MERPQIDSFQLPCTLVLSFLLILCYPVNAQVASKPRSGAKPTPVTQFGYKGMYLGMTVTEFSSNFQSRLSKDGWRFEGDAASTGRDCTDIMESCTLLSPEVDNLKIEPSFTRDGRLYFLKLSGFSSDRTNDFVKAFTKEYGPPRQHAKTYQNTFGAVYSGRQWEWFRGTAKHLSLLSIEENCTRLDTPCVALIDRRLAEQSEKEESQTLTVK